MGENEQPSYDNRDYWIIANNIFHRLCGLDKEDRDARRDPAWHDLRSIAKELGAYEIREDVLHIAEDILEQEKGFIERDPHTFNVRLTDPGRTSCGRRLEVSPTDED
jgi:hypothetical protein